MPVAIKDNEENLCPICQDKYKSPVILRCKVRAFIYMKYNIIKILKSHRIIIKKKIKLYSSSFAFFLYNQSMRFVKTAFAYGLTKRTRVPCVAPEWPLRSQNLKMARPLF
jgi:hypothetical protein